MLPATKDDDWKLWCRLCASKNTENSVNVYLNGKQTGAEKPFSQRVTTDFRLAAAIEKYFSVKIKFGDQLPKMICSVCYSTIRMLVNSSERITKVQHMFQVLLNCNTKINLDKDALRMKYDILDEENENNDDNAPTEKSLKPDMDNEVQIKQPSIDIKEEEIEIEEFLASSGIEAEMLDIEKDLTNLATENEEPTNSSQQKADRKGEGIDGTLDFALTPNVLNLHAGKIKKRTFTTQWLPKYYSKEACDVAAKSLQHYSARKRRFSSSQRRKLKALTLQGMSRPEAIEKLLTEPWGNVKCSTLNPVEKQSSTKEHVVRGLFQNSSGLTSRTILTHIEAQNNDISTTSWRVLERTEDGNTVYLVCVVDNITMSQFVSSNFEIWYHFGKTKFIKVSK